MSNFYGVLGSEMSVLCHWSDPETGARLGLQLLKDGRVAKVDDRLAVLETFTVAEARAFKASLTAVTENHRDSPAWREIREGKRP